MSDDLFSTVKPVCIALLGSASLTPTSIPRCLKHLDDLINILRVRSSEHPDLSPALVSYIFFPASSILQRNAPATIPDQILEKIFVVLRFLSESWWWHCEIAIWEQIFVLCGSVLGGMANKGKGKERDDEVKQAAADCLYALLRERDGGVLSAAKRQEARSRLAEFQNHAQLPRFVPILGQTVSAVIATLETRSFSLQQVSLKVLQALLDFYVPGQIFPMVFPGVVSSMSKVALGVNLEKQWANGEAVAASLRVMQTAVIKTIGDDICIREGALRDVFDLESLTELTAPSVTQESQTHAKSPFETKRSSAWLKGTATQIHIALNNLNSLTGHPNPTALRALASFAGRVLETTQQTLPQTQPLLLAFLLSISNSSFDSVSSDARAHLSFLLADASTSRAALLQTLMQNLSEYLSALPRLVSIQEENKVQHVTGLIEAICRLASGGGGSVDSPSAVSKGIGKLLGPSGGIEKWGWSLISVFVFSEAPLTVTQVSAEQLMLENDPHNSQFTAFPEPQLRNLGRDTQRSVEHMFRALGSAGGETCLYSVEWFMGIGRDGPRKDSVVAMWCACRLLEGISGINLSSEDTINRALPRTTKRLEKLARSLARNLPELWDQQTNDVDQPAPSTDVIQSLNDTSLVEYKKGLHPLHESLKITGPSLSATTENSDQPVNHLALTLQVISVCVGILQARSSTLFIHVLYPVLRSLVSTVPFLASTAYASLQFMTVVSSYASATNLLLSNFDYALDAISRRLTRRWLDVDATQVLAMLIRLVGSSIVEKAGDVVEECFDRLDEFHGYDILVQGFVSVLVEVTKVLKSDASSGLRREKDTVYTPYTQLFDLSNFFGWYRKRHEPLSNEEDKMDYGPAPRLAWGEQRQEQDEEKVEEEVKADVESPNDEPPPTPTQALTKQIVSRSLYFLTHGSPVIRARILALLESSIPNLPSSALMPSIHSAWPFILNRLGDQETFVVSSAASLIEALSTHMGEFMFRRIWDDVWPKFKTLLSQLQAGDATSALVHGGRGGINIQSAYTHSHRLYRAVLNTITAALQDVRLHDRSFWDALVLFRRFLDRTAHPELQESARKLYKAAMRQNADAVWLVLKATCTRDHPVLTFLYNEKWDITDNIRVVLGIAAT